MTSDGLGVPGVVRADLKEIADERGSFTEIWRGSSTDAAGVTFRQANLSRSRANVLRGMHFHDRQADLWIVLKGRASVALVDVRPSIAGSSETPESEEFVMEAGASVLIPARVAHGFLALENLELMYLVTAEYDGSDEHGFSWADRTVALRWPISEPVVSQRDASNSSFEAAVEAAHQRDLTSPGR